MQSITVQGSTLGNPCIRRTQAHGTNGPISWFTAGRLLSTYHTKVAIPAFKGMPGPFPSSLQNSELIMKNQSGGFGMSPRAQEQKLRKPPVPTLKQPDAVYLGILMLKDLSSGSAQQGGLCSSLESKVNSIVVVCSVLCGADRCGEDRLFRPTSFGMISTPFPSHVR